MKSAAPNERVRLVFISHAHEDETLAGCLASFLCAAVDGLSRDNVFLSSEAGHGVAPGESIRTAVLREAANAPVMIVVLTGSSLLNPWVWLEAGCRMGDGRQGAPLFVAPTIENLSQTPVADLMTLALDDNGQLHDLLKPIAKSLERRLVDFNSYKTAMDELTNCARAAESPRAVEGAKSSFERNKLGQVNRWIVAVLPIAMLVGVIGLSMLVYGLIQVGEADKLQDASISNSSDAFVTSASEYLRLQGQVVEVVDQRDVVIDDATVLVSKDQFIDKAERCREREAAKECTVVRTDSTGKFEVDLTKLQLTNKDQTPVHLIVIRPNQPIFTNQLSVDIRALDKADPPRRIVWSRSVQRTQP